MNYSPPQLLIAGQWRTGRGDTPSSFAIPPPEPRSAGCPAPVPTTCRMSWPARSTASTPGASGRRATCGVLERGVARMRESAEAIATLLTLEQGKPLAESRFEVMAACELIKWYAEEAKRVYGRLVPSRLPGGKMEVLKQPVGPVLALSPWNYPVILSARKIGGALAAAARWC